MNLIIRSLFGVALVCALASCTPEATVFPNENQFENELGADLLIEEQFAQDVLDLINEHRISIGKSELEFSYQSQQKAIEHSKYMAVQNRVSHDNFFERSDYLKENGANRVSENVAFGYYIAEDVVEAWLNSPSHKEAVEGDFTHSGIAVVESENGVTYFTQIFITQ